MPENKEFEKWFRDNYRCFDEDSVLCAFEKDLQDAFEAGQQSERNKHRWIPVTERLPDENEDVFIKYKDCNGEIKTCAGYYAHYTPSEDEIGYGKTLYIPYFDDEDDHYSDLSDYEIISWKKQETVK